YRNIFTVLLLQNGMHFKYLEHVYSNSLMESAGFDEEGHSLTDLTFDSDQITIRSSPSVTEDAYALYSPPSKRGGSTIEDDNEPLSKRHSDGVFTDSYSHYRKQMAVKKYLAAVLGKRYRQRYRSKGRRLAYL
uniref:Adenylate cyclase activating polypeptide 1a n=1 Tax=Cyprinus carpio TaxID=7962 RepID=A0A8C1SLB0_CYPCA